MPLKVTAIIAAAGSSARFGADKLMEKLGSETVLEKSIAAFEQNSAVNDIIVVTSEEHIPYVKKLPFQKIRFVVKGGDTRAASVRNGMRYVRESDYVMIHDGARPLVTQELIDRVVTAAFEYGAAAPFVPLKDSIKIMNGDFVRETVNRGSAMAVQTPQMFPAEKYAEALRNSTGEETDDCEIAEKAGIVIAKAEGDYDNIKITTREDIVAAKGLLGYSQYRVGQGYDVHRLERGETLILCGVKIPFEMGLVGHSDADVAIHAAADAVLGAAGLRDIGYHFPDSDPEYLGANSMELFRRCCEMASEKGYTVGNIDITIVAQQPKLAGYIDTMRANVAEAAGVSAEFVNVKATTEEGLGFTGEYRGISAHAVAMLVLE